MYGIFLSNFVRIAAGSPASADYEMEQAVAQTLNSQQTLAALLGEKSLFVAKFIVHFIKGVSMGVGIVVMDHLLTTGMLQRALFRRSSEAQ